VRVALIGGSGQASLSVEAIDTVHGHQTYRLALQMKGGWLWYDIDNEDRSWLDINQLFSRRFQQVHRESDKRDRTYEFFPDQMRYANPSVPADSGSLTNARPLDDISFLYHVRTLPLTMNMEYEEPRYYKAEGNPVIVRVLRRERVRVPAGEFDAIVVRPIIRTSSLFGDRGQGEVWISNDERRLIVKMRARVPAGTLNVDLQSFTPGVAVPPR
jgi:hypothetical protein